MAKVWTQDMPVDAALSLPEGRFAADFGFFVQQSVNPDHVLMAAQAIKDSKQIVVTASQAGVLVKDSELGLMPDSWAPLKLI
jgi:hypothetical protein